MAVVAVIAGGVWYFKRGHSDAPDYQTAPVTRGDLTQVVTATGTLNPVVNVTVGSQVSGIINKLNVDYNSMVKSNEVIAEIDPSTYQAAVEQATADLANAKANLELQQAEAERSAELFTNKLISGSDYDTAIATLHEAEATVQIKQASLDNANANLGYCKIRSPVDGIVISRAIDLGQTVASSFNTPTLFQIANDLTKMQIDSSVAEADVGGVVEGQGVDFTVDAYPYRTFYGTVTQVRNSPTNCQQRRHLRLCHQRDQFGLQVETRHDGECFHHHRPTRKCVDHSERRAAIPSAGKRRGADQLCCDANCAGHQRRQFCRHVRRAGPSQRPRARRTPGFSHGIMCFRARVTMRSCRRCRSRPASATAFRPRCFRGWTRARRL